VHVDIYIISKALLEISLNGTKFHILALSQAISQYIYKDFKKVA